LKEEAPKAGEKWAEQEEDEAKQKEKKSKIENHAKVVSVVASICCVFACVYLIVFLFCSFVESDRRKNSSFNAARNQRPRRKINAKKSWDQWDGAASHQTSKIWNLLMN
jgi:ABC-type phosphate transport system permease subunit